MADESKIIYCSEDRFRGQVDYWVGCLPWREKEFGLKFDCVTGPGRSGAIASVYISHRLGIPFLPFKCVPFGSCLVIDTIASTGETIRKAHRQVQRLAGEHPVHSDTIFPIGLRRHKFWYEVDYVEKLS